jgi:hypothetical protein
MEIAAMGDEALLSEVPEDTWGAFGYLVSRCASGVYTELVAKGKTDAEARNAVIHTFLDMACGEACRIARREGREPNKDKWQAAVDAAWSRAVKRTAQQS